MNLEKKLNAKKICTVLKRKSPQIASYIIGGIVGYYTGKYFGNHPYLGLSAGIFITKDILNDKEDIPLNGPPFCPLDDGQMEM